MVTPIAFTLLAAGVGLQRLLELRKSRENERRLFERGAREHAPEQIRLMQVVHTSWLLGSVLEVWLLAPPFRPWLAAFSMLVFLAGQALRLAAMRALGPRWSVRIITLRGESAVTSGIYRHLRHPNYLGVALEIAALPLIGGAFVSAAVGSALNLGVLWLRIRAEERALSADSDYGERLGDRPRFVPRLSGGRSAP